MDLDGLKLLFLDEISFGVADTNIENFIEQIKSKDETQADHQYPKYICSKERINAKKNEIDFKSPVYFFTYSSIQNAIQKIEKTVSKNNKIMEQFQELEKQNLQKQIDLEEQKIYKQLYIEQQEQIAELNFAIKESQINTNILEEEIKKLKGNQQQKQSQNIFNSPVSCKCYEKDNRINKLSKQCQEHRVKQLQEMEQNKKKDQKILELSTQIENMTIIHQQEIIKVQQQQKYKYLELLSNQEHQTCQYCNKTQGSIIKQKEKYDNLYKEFQILKESASLELRNKQSEINNLRSEFIKKNSVQCKCEQKDKEIEGLKQENDGLKQQVDNFQRKLSKYKDAFEDNQVDLEKSKKRYEYLYKINQENLQQLREKDKYNQDLKQYLEDTRKKTLENSQQILDYEEKFYKALEEKIESQRLLSLQLYQFNPNQQQATIEQLKQFIQKLQKNYDQLFDENRKFKESYKNIMTQITQHTARQSILRAGQQNQQI